MRRNQSPWLVVAPHLRRFGCRQRFAINHNLVTRADLTGWRRQPLAIDADTAIGNPTLRLAS